MMFVGKERGFLTYAEINDHLPDDVVDAESIEAIISTFSEMSIQVFDEAPAAEDLLMSDTAAAATDDEEVEALSEEATRAAAAIEERGCSSCRVFDAATRVGARARDVVNDEDDRCATIGAEDRAQKEDARIVVCFEGR